MNWLQLSEIQLQSLAEQDIVVASVKNIFLKNPKVLKSAVFGANDGITTTFAVVAGVAGAQLDSKIVLILGVANMIADGLSMGLGDFLGERSEREVRQNQGERKGRDKIWITGLASFLSFVVAGSFPLMPYALSLFQIVCIPNLFQASIISTIITLFLIGTLRTFVTKGKWWQNGLEMLGVGAITAGAAYFLGALVQKVV